MQQFRNYFRFLLILSPVLLFSAGANEEAIAKKKAADEYRQYVLEIKSSDMSWSGNVNNCRPGKLSDETNQKLLGQINYFRRLSGLSPVKLDSAWNRRAQAAALLMDANHTLTHSPTSKMHCYSAEAAAGAKTSNLSLGSSLFRIIPDQVSDGSTGNDACGHRRWLLYSKAYRVGVGSVNSAGAVCVLSDHSAADRDTSRFHGIVPEYFAYPFKGYVPYPLIYSKWTFSVPGAADFSAAYVSAVSDSKKINCSVISRTDNFGDPTIVWTVNEEMYKYSDKKIAVTVSNVKVNGQMKSYSYSFTVIDPYAH